MMQIQCSCTREENAPICRGLDPGGILRPVKKPLIIVESPTKARTIKKFLPARYAVKASVGHVRDLPKSTLGVDVENDFSPKYLTIKGKGEIIKELRGAVKSASDVYLATDPDREGEAIAWHLAELLKLPDPKRIELHEITKEAALAALKHPHLIDMDRVNAQQARRILDRLVGYKISPLLWSKVRSGLSAGRVQSVAVKIIVDREREIEAFIPREYWTIAALLESSCEARRGGEPTAFSADLVTHRGEKIEIGNAAEADAILRALDGADLPRFVDQAARGSPQSAGAFHHLDATARGVAQAQDARSPRDAGCPKSLRGSRSRRQRGNRRFDHLHANRLDSHQRSGARGRPVVHRRLLRRRVPWRSSLSRS